MFSPLAKRRAICTIGVRAEIMVSLAGEGLE